MTAPTKPVKRSGTGHHGSMRDQRLAASTRRRKSTGDELVNPLREGLRLERMPDPCLLVLFGATGDLALRRVLPALYQLWRSNLLPHEFRLLGAARRPYDDDTFREEMHKAVPK